MRIELFQDLYKRYSRLALSYPSDRPIAIRGLEARLLTTFNTTGGYGILDKYLQRSLLWQRSGKAISRVSGPSWSWMAYDGPIDYMAVPLGEDKSWFEGITSPFAKGGQPSVLSRSQLESEDVISTTLAIGAPVWEIVDMTDAEIILDDPHCHIGQPLQCIVVGKSTVEPLDEHQAHYVLLVHHVSNVEEDQVYERIGVGILGRHQIALGGPYRYARIR